MAMAIPEPQQPDWQAQAALGRLTRPMTPTNGPKLSRPPFAEQPQMPMPQPMAAQPQPMEQPTPRPSPRPQAQAPMPMPAPPAQAPMPMATPARRIPSFINRQRIRSGRSPFGR